MTSPGWPASNAKGSSATPRCSTSWADGRDWARIILHLEHSVALLDSLGLDTRTSIDVLMTLNTYVLGAVIRELQEMRDQRHIDAIGPDRASGRFTRFLRIFDEGIDPDAPETREERFAFGLQCALDGIAVQIERRTS